MVHGRIELSEKGVESHQRELALALYIMLLIVPAETTVSRLSFLTGSLSCFDVCRGLEHSRAKGVAPPL